MAGVVLQVDDLRTYFYTSRGIVRAVDGISYDIERAETVALVGESGSGKSVSALAILRLVPYPGKVVGGRVLFNGEDLLQAPENRMREIRGHGIAMVFQEPMTSLNPTMTIGAQLAEPLRFHLGMNGQSARQRVIELLNTVGIQDPERLCRSYPHQASGGMRQRVLIAMALSCNPEIVIADEATTALDVTLQAQILDMLTGFSRQTGASVLLITHNMGIVARYADKINVMYEGKLVESGTCEEVMDHAKHAYTLRLLQCVPRIDRKDWQLGGGEGRPEK
ncbi:MAG: ABC transporter ATP-binding protein [Chloroflexi bacterium]|nr:ABC transporter ATP-binding protein [Chloroflexota bacterium]